MPYNPSSAYPRHTTWTPPTEGRGFARGFNQIDWGTRFGGHAQAVIPDMGHALRAAAPRDTGAAGQVREMINRQGLLSVASRAGQQKASQLASIRIGRKAWNRAEYGDDPNEQKTEQLPTEIDTRTPEGRAAAAKIWPGGTGGREHVAPVNERLGDIETRKTLTTGVEKAFNKVLTGKVGGAMQVAWKMGSGVRRKGA